MMNEEKNKVLFAVADSSFADVLLSFMTLPLGQIRLLLRNHYGDKAPTIGSLETLYNGLQQMDNDYFFTKAGKLMLLNPISSLQYEVCLKLKLNICRTQPTKYFTCGCSFKREVGLYQEGAICSHCGKLMNTAIKVVDGHAQPKGDYEVFTKQTVSFVIADHLQMLSNVTMGSLIQNIKSLGVTDIPGAQQITVPVGFNEVMYLLKGLMSLKTPLTDLFIHNGPLVHHHSSTIKPLLVPELKEKANNCSTKKMKINAIVQKSSNKFLFAQVENDFVSFLFSLLTVPLGQVEHLLNSNSGLVSIDNLYRSLADFNGVKCFVTQYTKDNLLKPKLPHKYLSVDHIFPLEEQVKPLLYCRKSSDGLSCELSHSYSYEGEVHFADPLSMGGYVKGNRMLMVTDDLTVTPLFMHQGLSNLMGLEVPITDIEELEINIGLEEALSILKASLTSKCAMTEGLN